MEKHVYLTDDGYINTVFRIRGNASKRGDGDKVAIYNHGITKTCAGILCDDKDSLGYRLIQQGFDLWMNNNRCNRFSRDHQTIDLENCSKKDKETYFNVSFDEMAMYDQPALWKYVIK